MMRAFDWSSTPVGPVEGWPQSLRTAVSIVLESGFPMYIVWGPQYQQFYNDGFRPILGSTKHPALGKGSPETFREIWDIIGPMFAEVRQGKAVNLVDAMIPLDRHGFLEECYFLFSYSPIRDETGGVGGILVTVSETSSRVRGERRMVTLRDLASAGSGMASEEQAWQEGLEVLARNAKDIPFGVLRLPGRTPRAFPGTPESVAAVSWPEAEAGRIIDDVQRLSPGLVGTEWPEPVVHALVLPLPGHGADASLVLGLSPRQLHDAEYRAFLRTAVDQLAGVVATTRARDAERQRARALAELDRAKTEFFSNVSHEFRTPLTLMLAPVEGLLGRLQGAEHDDLQLVHRNALRLLKLVNNLLDFARVEAGRMQTNLAPVDAGTLTADLASAFRSAAHQAGMELVVDSPPLTQPVAIDPDLWEKIVLNLVSNALKFTHRGTITVRLRASVTDLVLTVADTGVGIAPADLPRLFERFHRVPSSPGRVHEGTGIGLALVRELAQLLGGRVEVDSRLGAGSEFRVTLPRRDPASAAAVRAAGEGSHVAETFVAEAAQWTRPADDNPSPDPADSATVLVVDDNHDMRGFLVRVLRGRWRVESAADGAQALEAIGRRRPDLILADIMMPNVDGLELLRRVRADPALRDLPFILLSARAGEEAKIDGVEDGADDYLVKPFSPRELVARIASNLKLARLRQEQQRQLDELERRSARLTEEAADGIVVLDRTWTITYANRAAGEWLRRDRSELVGKSLVEVYPQLPGTRFMAVYEQCMADRQPRHLEEYFEPMKSWYEVRVFPVEEGIGLSYRDVTMRRQMAEALRRQHSHLEQVVEERTQKLAGANSELQAFNYMVSHDLRSHLRVLGAYSDLALHRHQRDLTPAVEELLRKIHAGALQTGRFLEELLDFSRFHLAPITVTAVDLSALSRKLLEGLEEQSPDRIVEWSVEDGLSVQGDAALLAIVMENLLRNAWKFTSKRPRATIRVERGEGGAVVVRDDGEGFDPQYADTLFQPFQRLHAASDFPGNGIGLAGVARIVRRHGGEVHARGEPGRGATFAFTLPNRPLPAPLI